GQTEARRTNGEGKEMPAEAHTTSATTSLPERTKNLHAREKLGRPAEVVHHRGSHDGCAGSFCGLRDSPQAFDRRAAEAAHARRRQAHARTRGGGPRTRWGE